MCIYSRDGPPGALAGRDGEMSNYGDVTRCICTCQTLNCAVQGSMSAWLSDCDSVCGKEGREMDGVAFLAGGRWGIMYTTARAKRDSLSFRV